MKLFKMRFSESRIARKLIIAIILFSSLLTLIITAMQLFNDYEEGVAGIYAEIDSIRHNHLDAISHSIWIFDPTSTQIVLDSLGKHPDIEYLQVYVDQTSSWETGRRVSKNHIVEEIPLIYSSGGNNKNIGTLQVVASLDGIYRRLLKKTVVILLTNGVKTFLVALFSFVIFQLLVTRHLVKLGGYAKQVKPGGVMEPLSLERRREKSSKPDELDYLVTAINVMQSSLSNEIVKLKESEEQVRKNHALLNDIMEGTTDAIFLKDLQGLYLMANRAACEMMGKTPEEIIGKNDEMLFPGASAKIIIGNDAQVMESGLTLETEERLSTAYGDSFWLTKKSPYRDKGGKIIGLIGISRNITQLKTFEREKVELEKRLNQAQKMEAIGTLAGGIAHDFNNILGAILGYAGMARDDAAPESTIAKDLDQIIVAGHRAKDLVKQILAFSRQANEHLISFNPGTILRDAMKMLRASIPTTISINERIDPACGDIFTDPTHFYQIIMNLCTNAFHAMEKDGGELSVVLHNVELSAEEIPSEETVKSGKFVELSVKDTGHGIDPSIKDKIFDPYFTTKDTGKGTGMGLAIIHGIMKSCGGMIKVESDRQNGTTFRVFFPLTSKESKKEADLFENIPTGRERILFIDDEEFLVYMGKDMLERLGYQVTIKTSSSDALAIFRNDPEKFDLVITDQTMPGMTGSDLAMKMLQIRKDLPIILCTGYSSVISAEEAKAMGIREFVLKPMIKGDIAKIVRKVLDEPLA